MIIWRSSRLVITATCLNQLHMAYLTEVRRRLIIFFKKVRSRRDQGGGEDTSERHSCSGWRAGLQRQVRYPKVSTVMGLTGYLVNNLGTELLREASHPRNQHEAA
jgi:hypothetical protein